MDNQSIQHIRWNYTYHIVFIPKYRRKIMYGETKRDKLIDRITNNSMQPDHIWELQLSGPDSASNIRFLDTYTNWHIGTQQIWPQIRNWPEGTKVTISVEW